MSPGYAASVSERDAAHARTFGTIQLLVSVRADPFGIGDAGGMGDAAGIGDGGGITERAGGIRDGALVAVAAMVASLR